MQKNRNEPTKFFIRYAFSLFYHILFRLAAKQILLFSLISVHQ